MDPLPSSWFWSISVWLIASGWKALEPCDRALSALVRAQDSSPLSNR